MNEFVLGLVIKSTTLLTDLLGSRDVEECLKGREKEEAHFLSPLLSGKRCTTERCGELAESLTFPKSVFFTHMHKTQQLA